MHHFLIIINFLIFALLFNFANGHCFSSHTLNGAQLDNDECCGENMVYTLKMNESCSILGKKFDCSFAWLLERYKLSDKYEIKEKTEVKFPGHPKFVFATAASANLFPSLRVLIANIKEKFGCRQKIIAYDLGNVTTNNEWVTELNSMCNLEWRVFDFSQMVSGRVRQLNSYAWKVFAMAHVFSEYDTVVWVDTSISFDNDNLSSILRQIQTGQIGPVQLLGYTGHGKNIATHPGMYKYLPMVANFGPNKTYEWTGNDDPPQFEANLVILHKTEQTRQLMKWALLCAAEPDCIVPLGQTHECLYTPIGPKLTCHRQHQSLLDVLLFNMEYRQQIEDPTFLAHIRPAHPRWSAKFSFRMDNTQMVIESPKELHQNAKCC